MTKNSLFCEETIDLITEEISCFSKERVVISQAKLPPKVCKTRMSAGNHAEAWQSYAYSMQQAAKREYFSQDMGSKPEPPDNLGLCAPNYRP